MAARHRRPGDRGERDRRAVDAAPHRARVVDGAGEHEHAEHDDGPALQHAQRARLESLDVLEPERRRHQRNAGRESACQKQSLE